jgi:hypothetical protein
MFALFLFRSVFVVSCKYTFQSCNYDCFPSWRRHRRRLLNMIVYQYSNKTASGWLFMLWQRERERERCEVKFVSRFLFGTSLLLVVVLKVIRVYYRRSNTAHGPIVLCLSLRIIEDIQSQVCNLYLQIWSLEPCLIGLLFIKTQWNNHLTHVIFIGKHNFVQPEKETWWYECRRLKLIDLTLTRWRSLWQHS